MSVACPYCFAEIDPRIERCPHCGGVFDPLLATGTRIARRFEILEVVGMGLLGVTYRARDHASDQDVSVKLIANELCATATDRTALVQKLERLVGRPLAGCNALVAVGADSHGAWAIAPMLDAVSLRAVISARRSHKKPLELEEAAWVLVSIAAAVTALHSVNPHGGLRPENVLLTAEGLVLNDCAVATAVNLEALAARAQNFPRAQRYIASDPMRVRKVTAIADLFALGAIAAELFTGTATAEAVERATSLHEGLRAAVLSLLDREPGKRAAGIANLLDALAAIVGQEQRLPAFLLPATGASESMPPPPPVSQVPPPPATIPPAQGTVPPPAPTVRESETRKSTAPAVVPAATSQPPAAMVRPHVRVPSFRPSEPVKPPVVAAGPVTPSRSNAPRDGSAPVARGITARNPAASIPIPKIPRFQSGPPSAMPAIGKAPTVPPPAPTVKSTLPLSAPGLAPARKSEVPPPAGIKMPSSSPAIPRPMTTPLQPMKRPQLDDIDPRLLRAAAELDTQKKISPDEEISDDEIEAIDED